MNFNVIAAIANLGLFAFFMSQAWYGPAIVAVVCAAFGLCLAAMDRSR